MIGRLAAGLVLLTWMGAATAFACPRSYQVLPGDSLSRIAEITYQNAFLWTEIYAANRSVIGPDPDTILPGAIFSLPCRDAAIVQRQRDGLPSSLRPPVTDEADAVVSEPAIASETVTVTVTGVKGLAPFSEPSLLNGGLLVDVMEQAVGRMQPAALVTVRHAEIDAQPDLQPGLEIVVPALAQHCALSAERGACAHLMLTTPLFEALEIVFARSDAPVPLASPEDMHGRHLCRPRGMSLDVLDADGRNWVADDLIRVTHSMSVDACFAAVRAGEVDGVVINEFTGREAVERLGYDGEVIPLTKTPLAVLHLRAGIDRETPGVSDQIAELDRAILQLRESGTYRQLVRRHLVAP